MLLTPSEEGDGETGGWFVPDSSLKSGMTLLTVTFAVENLHRTEGVALFTPSEEGDGETGGWFVP
jgi:hypothetical protein